MQYLRGAENLRCINKNQHPRSCLAWIAFDPPAGRLRAALVTDYIEHTCEKPNFTQPKTPNFQLSTFNLQLCAVTSFYSHTTLAPCHLPLATKVQLHLFT